MIEKLTIFDCILLSIAIVVFLVSSCKLITRAVMKIKIRNAVLRIWERDMLNKIDNNSIQANAIMYYFYENYIYDQEIFSNTTQKEFAESVARYAELSKLIEKMSKYSPNEKKEEENINGN